MHLYVQHAGSLKLQQNQIAASLVAASQTPQSHSSPAVHVEHLELSARLRVAGDDVADSVRRRRAKRHEYERWENVRGLGNVNIVQGSDQTLVGPGQPWSWLCWFKLSCSEVCMLINMTGNQSRIDTCDLYAQNCSKACLATSAHHCHQHRDMLGRGAWLTLCLYCCPCCAMCNVVSLIRCLTSRFSLMFLLCWYRLGAV